MVRSLSQWRADRKEGGTAHRFASRALVLGALSMPVFAIVAPVNQASADDISTIQNHATERCLHRAQTDRS